MANRNSNTLLRRVLDLSNQNKTLLSKSQVNSRLLFPISNLISESMVLDILMMFQFLSYGNFIKGSTLNTEETCILYEHMEPDVIAFIKRIIRALGLASHDLLTSSNEISEPNRKIFIDFLEETFKYFMCIYGLFSASIPNVENNALYGGIKVSDITRSQNGECGIKMYRFDGTKQDSILCNATRCNVHMPLRTWIPKRINYLDEALQHPNVNNIVAAFLRMFLRIFQIKILGINVINDVQHVLINKINNDYEIVAKEFKSHIHLSLQRGITRRQ